MNKDFDRKLDIIGMTVLDRVRNQKGFTDAIIAGGYCRDLILGGPFKDVDIFTPSLKDNDAVYELASHPPKDFVLKDHKVKIDKKPYGNKRLISVLDLVYLESVPVQIIATNYPDKDFANKCVSDFSFGIDQVWASSEEIQYTDAFNSDTRFNKATLLVDKLDISEELPVHMKKFLRLQEKYPNLVFYCPQLSFNGKKEEKKDTIVTYKPQHGYQVIDDGAQHINWNHIAQAAWGNAHVPAQANPAGEITLNLNPEPTPMHTLLVTQDMLDNHPLITTPPDQLEMMSNQQFNDLEMDYLQLLDQFNLQNQQNVG